MCIIDNLLLSQNEIYGGRMQIKGCVKYHRIAISLFSFVILVLNNFNWHLFRLLLSLIFVKFIASYWAMLLSHFSNLTSFNSRIYTLFYFEIEKCRSSLLNSMFFNTIVLIWLFWVNISETRAKENFDNCLKKISSTICRLYSREQFNLKDGEF